MRREGMKREAIGKEQAEGVNGQQGNKQPAWVTAAAYRRGRTTN